MKSNKNLAVKSSLIKGRAWAKTNLFLGVGDRSVKSNLHRIETFYVRLDISDDVCIEIRPSDSAKITTEVSLSEQLKEHLKYQKIDPSDYLDSVSNEKNDAQKAVSLLLNKIDKSADVKIKIFKNLPSEAGLGGGSADAACALRLLQREFSIPDVDIINVAKQVSADVYPCLFENPSFSLMSSDQLFVIRNPTNSIKDLKVLISKPPIGSATSLAYSSLNRRRSEKSVEHEERGLLSLKYLRGMLQGEFPSEIAKLIDGIGGREVQLAGSVERYFYNDFEENVFSQIPDLRSAKNYFLEKGASVSFLSGSGSSLVSFFESNQNLSEVKTGFKNSMGKNWWVEESAIHF